jgi:hypothetical protein
MCKAEEMKRDDLLQMKDEIDKELKKFKKINIRSKWKRCGKKGCFCSDGPLDGSWGNLHGPYVFAQFVDQETGKYRSVSLGAYYSKEFADQVIGEPTQWNDYFRVPEREYEMFNTPKQDLYNWYIYLSSDQFYEFHGIKMHEDTMDRDRVFYGTKANHDAYHNKIDARIRQLELVKSGWCRKYGIGDEIGHIKLSELLAGKYYLAWV